MRLAKAIETTGFVNEQPQLLLDESLPIPKSSRVRVIIILPEEVQLTESETILKRDPKIIDSLCGSFKNCLSSSDDFSKRKSYFKEA